MVMAHPESGNVDPTIWVSDGLTELVEGTTREKQRGVQSDELA
jgi:hypothetical protein